MPTIGSGLKCWFFIFMKVKKFFPLFTLDCQLPNREDLALTLRWKSDASVLNWSVFCSFQFCEHVGSIWEYRCLSREIESSKREVVVKTNQDSWFFYVYIIIGVNKRFLTSLLCLCYPTWPPLPWYLSGLVASHKYEESSLLESVICLLAEITC